MKAPLIAFTTLLLTAVCGLVNAQDTTSRPKAAPAPAKTTTEGSKNQDTNPVINKIAVSDPGMPAEKPVNNSNKRNAPKQEEKKKKSRSGATPK